MPATPGGLKAVRLPPGHAKQEGVRLLTGHFVGRAGELAWLEQILDELDRGCPGAIEVAGEPGIGKTRLLGELAARAGARGHLVLSGAASEFENDLPFSVFVDALDEYVAGLEPGRLGALGGAGPGRARAHLSRRCRRWRWATTWHPSTSAIAATVPYGRCSKHLAPTLPLVLILDDFTGPTQRRPSCWARCCAGHRPHRCSWLARSAPGRPQNVWPSRWTERTVPQP
jgi:hypothetical protein